MDGYGETVIRLPKISEGNVKGRKPVAIGKKSGGKDFVPGQSGNPKGGNSLPPEIKALKKLTPGYIKGIISKIALMPREQLMVYLQDPGIAQIELTVASILVKATSDGDSAKLQFLLDRSIGKVTEQRTVTLQPVEYITKTRPDGALVRSVINEALGEDDDGEPGEDPDQGNSP